MRQGDRGGGAQQAEGQREEVGRGLWSHQDWKGQEVHVEPHRVPGDVKSGTGKQSF